MVSVLDSLSVLKKSGSFLTRLSSWCHQKQGVTSHRSQIQRGTYNGCMKYPACVAKLRSGGSMPGRDRVLAHVIYFTSVVEHTI
jgi:hypothetical protein